MSRRATRINSRGEAKEAKERSRPRNIIRIPKSIPKPLASTSRDPPLVIVIPPAKYVDTRAEKGIKRALEIDEEAEDSTLIGIPSRSSKRSRLLPDVPSDDDTLISVSFLKKSTRRPKVSSRSTSKRKTPTTTTSAVQTCSYSGLFDIYAMDHQDLCEIYRPNGSTEPQYEDLYHSLRDQSSSQKLTARVALPNTPYGRKFGSASASVLCDPTTSEPYDIEVTRISHVNRVFYRDHEKECFATRYGSDVSMVGKTPGVSGKMAVNAENSGVLDSSGDFNMSRVWEKVDEEGRVMEIFEGYLSLRVRYCRMYDKMGYGSGLDLGFAFWALRR